MTPPPLSEILPPSHIFVGAEWQSKKRAFEQASIVFENAAGVARDRIFSVLMQRERLGSTFIGNGGAIPHGQLEEAAAPMCALALLKKAVPYGGDDDGGAVRTMFFLIAPADGGEMHLQLLGLFAEMLSDCKLMDALHNCGDEEHAAALLTQWESQRDQNGGGH